MISDFKYTISRLLTFFALLSVVTTSCTNEAPEVPGTGQISGDEIVVQGALTLPDMSVSVSRGLFGPTVADSDLKLTILEFDKGADDSHSFLSHVYKAEIMTATNVGNNVLVKFKVTIYKSDSPKILHLMLADDYVSTQFGSVATVLPSLYVADRREAYWGTVEFPDGYNTTDSEGSVTLNPDVKSKLTAVPMIRNFAMITVSENLSNFELLGFDVVNVPTSGTIAPWDQNTLSVPSMLKTDGSMESYKNIKYQGYIPGDAGFGNTEVQAKASWTSSSQNMLSTTTRYLYEHPYESTRRSYLIIYGIYTSGSVPTPGFYKVDIGGLDNDGMFQNYNIIRNIHYNVVITSVQAAGMSTVAEAIDRAPFNNISAATETSAMLNVSDNTNMLVVNDTNHIIVDNDQTIDVFYRYVQNLKTDPKEDNTIPHTVGLGPENVPGPVIKSVSPATPYTDSQGVNWMKIILTCNNPDDIVKTQSFSIVDGTGLGRTINLVLRKPWSYDRLKYANGVESDYFATVAPVTANTYTTPVPQNISAQNGEPVTLFFDLPDGLPETMFPLYFQLEPKYQGLENDKVGNMVVSTGPSLFDPNVTAISYIKTVTYMEYRYQYINDTSSEFDISKINRDHTIRCRFLTINSVESGSEGEIMIHNDYFSPDVSVKFKRE